MAIARPDLGPELRAAGSPASITPSPAASTTPIIAASDREFFRYEEARAAGHVEDAIRADLTEAHRRAWERLANAGTWWTGAERVAIAAEVRAAPGCALCQERRSALSPFASFSGGGAVGSTAERKHDSVSEAVLPVAAVDAVHRLVTDASRLTQKWVDGLADEGVSDTHYVEMLSVVVAMMSIDGFHHAIGLPPERLPAPRAGEPSRKRPVDAVQAGAWVAMLPNRKPAGENADLWSGPMANVIRAMSLVPDAVRWLLELSGAQYLLPREVANPTKTRGPLLRSQTELIAGRVSAINECFY